MRIDPIYTYRTLHSTQHVLQTVTSIVRDVLPIVVIQKGVVRGRTIYSCENTYGVKKWPGSSNGLYVYGEPTVPVVSLNVKDWLDSGSQ